MTHQRSHGYVLGLVILVLILGGILWYMDTKTDTPYVSPVSPVVQVPAATTDTVYSNQQYGFSMSYGKAFTLDSADQNTNAQWSYNSSYSGSRVVGLRLPKESQPKTNFSEAVVSVGVSTDANAVKQCLTAQNGETIVADPAAQAKGFHVFSLGDAGAGNYYETMSYRIVRGNACLALETMVHSTNIGNYDPSQGISEFDHAAVNAALAAVVDSFSFAK